MSWRSLAGGGLSRLYPAEWRTCSGFRIPLTWNAVRLHCKAEGLMGAAMVAWERGGSQAVVVIVVIAVVAVSHTA
jgi:hypothetical protein